MMISSLNTRAGQYLHPKLFRIRLEEFGHKLQTAIVSETEWYPEV